MIDSLLYLIASGIDICFTIGICAHYQANPNKSHLQHDKRIIKNISRTSNYGINFTNGTTYEISSYIDADWARNQDDRKSTSGRCSYISRCFYIGRCSYIGNKIVSWHSKQGNFI